MKSSFEIAYEPVKKWEGGWCNVEGDAGGETYAGVARNFFPDWSGWQIIDDAKIHESFFVSPKVFSFYLAKDAKLEKAVHEFYKKEWWNKLGLEVLPQIVANEIFEQSINLGMGGAGKYVQRACNALNYNNKTKASYFDDLVEDGVLGQKSLAAISLLLSTKIKPEDFVHVLNGLQISHYINLGARNIYHRKFVSGWLTRTK